MEDFRRQALIGHGELLRGADAGQPFSSVTMGEPLAAGLHRCCGAFADMKLLFNLVILGGIVGAFFSGFVFWIANSSHQQAERLRQHGEYCDVRVVDKKTSSPGDGSSENYYVYVRRMNQKDDQPLIQCAVVSSAFDRLRIGQQLKAWVLETNARLDDGPKNAGSVAQTMRLTCAGFALLTMVGLIGGLVCRTSRVERTRGGPLTQLKSGTSAAAASRRSP